MNQIIDIDALVNDEYANGYQVVLTDIPGFDLPLITVYDENAVFDPVVSQSLANDLPNATGYGSDIWIFDGSNGSFHVEYDQSPDSLNEYAFDSNDEVGEVGLYIDFIANENYPEYAGSDTVIRTYYPNLMSLDYFPDRDVLLNTTLEVLSNL